MPSVVGYDRKRGCLRALLAVGIVGAMLVAVGLVWSADLIPPQKPSDAEVQSFVSMLRNETRERWNGRVDFESGGLVVEKGESDFPPHQYRIYTYLAVFRVHGTDARFVVPFPVNATRDELRDWGLFSSDLPQQEVDALQGYARAGGDPPIMIWRETELYGRPDADEIWRIGTVDRDAVFLSGEDVFLEKRRGGYTIFDPAAETE